MTTTKRSNCTKIQGQRGERGEGHLMMDHELFLDAPKLHVKLYQNLRSTLIISFAMVPPLVSQSPPSQPKEPLSNHVPCSGSLNIHRGQSTFRASPQSQSKKCTSSLFIFVGFFTFTPHSANIAIIQSTNNNNNNETSVIKNCNWLTDCGPVLIHALIPAA